MIVECIMSSDCPDDGPVCDNGACRVCIAHGECKDNDKLFCEKVSGVCRGQNEYWTNIYNLQTYSLYSRKIWGLQRKIYSKILIL